jgi:hypothetical protein
MNDRVGGWVEDEGRWMDRWIDGEMDRGLYISMDRLIDV